jgi:hypothetical protein
LYQVPPGARALQFTVIYAEPSVPSGSWPGADAMGTTLVGRFTLPGSNETVHVVAHPIENVPGLNPKSAQANLLPGFTVDDVRQAAKERTLHGIAFAQDDNDGMRCFVDFAGELGPAPAVA